MHDVPATALPRKPARVIGATRKPPLLVGTLLAMDAALFAAMAALHLGASLGSVSAPRAHWAAPIELFGAVCCTFGAGAVWTRTGLAREIAWIVGGIAIWCVMLGVVAFSAGLDPCTPITDIHYGMTASITFLSMWRMSRWQRGLSWPP